MLPILLAAAQLPTPAPGTIPGPAPGAKVWTTTDFPRAPMDPDAGAAAKRSSKAQNREHYPDEALHRHEQGKSIAGVAVGTDGWATRCWMLQSSGSDSLDAATCRIVLTRIHWSPASDPGGTPVESNAAVPITWKLP